MTANGNINPNRERQLNRSGSERVKQGWRECARQRSVDGGDIALPLAAGWLSLVMDTQLGRAHCHQHVTLSVFGVVIIGRQAQHFHRLR